MTIQIDSREHQKAIQKILSDFDKAGVKHLTSKLYVGDYMNYDNPRLVVDRKQNLTELASNVCQDHDRFRNEIIRANENGIHIIFLCEHGQGIDCLEDVIFWKNPRLKKSNKAITGEKLYNILTTIERKYGVEFLFCSKAQTGTEIIRLLHEHSTD